MKLIENNTTINRGFFSGTITVESEQGDRVSIPTQGAPTYDLAAKRVLCYLEEIAVESLGAGQRFFAPFGNLCTFDSWSEHPTDEAEITQVHTPTGTISYGRGTTVIAYLLQPDFPHKLRTAKVA